MADYDMKTSVFFAIILCFGLVYCENSTDTGTLIPVSDQIDNEPLPEWDYPAQPDTGKIFWGASMQLTLHGPEERHEEPSGETLALHRSFWRWDQRTGNMLNVATDDIANGRLPWVSVKPPPCENPDPDCSSWQWLGMAKGKFDDEIDEMLYALAALKKPIWLTIHHEPEGGGVKQNLMTRLVDLLHISV
ncbi:MAG: hypothetical protein WD267_09265 [Balneolales bacterium]